jgi:hypothetical protein
MGKKKKADYRRAANKKVSAKEDKEEFHLLKRVSA